MLQFPNKLGFREIVRAPRAPRYDPWCVQLCGGHLTLIRERHDFSVVRQLSSWRQDVVTLFGVGSFLFTKLNPPPLGEGATRGAYLSGGIMEFLQLCGPIIPISAPFG